MDDQSYDRDEYETDTDASSSDYDTDRDGSGSDTGPGCDGDDGPDDELRYSLVVRLLSAVDLPPSLSPSVPLCPWFRLGLVEDLGEALDGVSEERRRARAREESGREERGRRTLMPRSQGDDSDGEDGEEDRGDEPARLAAAAGLNTTARLLAGLPPRSVRTSAHKVMSRNANGGGGNGADWNEEYRWDDLASPMESCLAVQLVTRLAPEGRYEAPPAGPGPGGAAGHDGGTDGDGPDDAGAALAGIRGLWRKGREQLEQRRMAAEGGGLGGSSTSAPLSSSGRAGPREEAAAAAAQVLMRPEPDAAGGGGGLDQGDLVDYQRRWNERSAGDAAGADRTGSGHRGDYVEGAVRTTRSEDEDDAAGSEGLCLGTLSVPIHRLELTEAVFEGRERAVLERWYQLDDPNVKRKAENDGEERGPLEDDADGPTLLHGPRRFPHVQLEITFAATDYLDAAEDEVHGGAAGADVGLGGEGGLSRGPATPVPDGPATPGAAPTPKDDPPKADEPELVPGVVDFVTVIGARDIGQQKNDDGSRGWVQSTPACATLERFPPDDEFHVNNGRMTGLPQLEWYCFPEGCRLWRGTRAPTAAEMREEGVSVSSAVAAGDGGTGRGTATAAEHRPSRFDRVLGTAASFSWFVFSSQGTDVRRMVKTYCTLVRFYVPAPTGVDPTQDDYAQVLMGGAGNQKGGKAGNDGGGKARLWVPVGICMTTTLPIVGVVEEILLRICAAMASGHADDAGTSATGPLTGTDGSSTSRTSVASRVHGLMQRDLYHLIVNASTPIPGVVNCSVPFLDGERLRISVPPPSGLPPLPHGGCVASTCRLLGAEGLTLLLAAALTEHHILIHSSDVAAVAMVAEVVTALLFPFAWQHAYIPVLPRDVLEVLEAPYPIFVGVPTVNLKLVDKSVLSEIVVVDLDDVASFTEYDPRRGARAKVPPALPASVSQSISKAVSQLIKDDDELTRMMAKAYWPQALCRSTRLEQESLPERTFRIHVAVQICSLVRGYQECLFFVSASQPVFNRDRFLRQAPALFEDKRPSVLIDSNISDRISQRILSPRSKKFLSVLVNSQHFHHLLERLSDEETALFHEVMMAIEPEEDPATGAKDYSSIAFGSPTCDEAVRRLNESLDALEGKVPTYRVDRPSRPRDISWEADKEDEWNSYEPYVDKGEPFWVLPERKKTGTAFTHGVLEPIMVNNSGSTESSTGVHALSLEYLVELEKNPWRYSGIFDLSVKEEIKAEDGSKDQVRHIVHPRLGKLLDRVKLRDAIGERRYRAWKRETDHKDDDDLAAGTPVVEPTDTEGFDLSNLLLNIPELPLAEANPAESQPQKDAEDRDQIRQCLELAFSSTQQESVDFEGEGHELVVAAELALRNPSAQRYLFSVLMQRTKIENQRKKKTDDKQRSNQQSVSRLEPGAFECIVRLCYAVLEAFTEEQNYESAYRLLTLTSGFCTASGSSSQPTAEQQTLFMTERISIHPIFDDFRLWERVLLLHQQDQQKARKEMEEAEKEQSIEGEEGKDESKEDGQQPVQSSADAVDSDAYDAVVTTLYEMVGYNVPAEEVSRFATRVAEEKGWFANEKGQALLVLSRRLTAKRDEGDGEGKSRGADVNTAFMRKESSARDALGAVVLGPNAALRSSEIAYNHPQVCLVSHEKKDGARAFIGNILGGGGSTSTLTAADTPSNSTHGLPRRSSKKSVLDAQDHAGRVAITAMASFGSSAIVTGGIDGSIFLAHSIQFGGDKGAGSLNGVQLQWGGKTEADRGTGSGSITCLAACRGSAYRFGSSEKASSTKSVNDEPDDSEVASAMEGCRIIGGTTGGGLRVWSLKDIFSASIRARNEFSGLSGSPTSSVNRTAQNAAWDEDFAEAVAGISIGGHRGGVTCVDLPNQLYRADSLVSGGEDGLIKLCSLKSSDDPNQRKNTLLSRFSNTQALPTSTDFDASETQGVLTGHEGKVICIKTAWHGDKLLSGGADKTVRLWDLSSTGRSKPLTSLVGHQGWVTQTHFWGPNTIVSSSTDRSIFLWDTRIGSSPLFALRYHLSPISSLLLGNRSEPLMVSACADGSLATWDFRVLAGARNNEKTPTVDETKATPEGVQCSRSIRTPIATMKSMSTGVVRLARSVGRDDFSFMSLGDDGAVKEWEPSTGRKISSHASGHQDAISGFDSYGAADCLLQTSGCGLGGTISCSWDGTVRLRKLSRESN